MAEYVGRGEAIKARRNDYIKRIDAVKARHGCDGKCSDCDFAEDGDSWCNGEVFVVDLLRVPAADVAPVVHGRWVDGKCDNCGEHAPYWCLATTFHESNYCPNCGAKMDADMQEVSHDPS